jgi:hypothetical protein
VCAGYELEAAGVLDDSLFFEPFESPEPVDELSELDDELLLSLEPEEPPSPDDEEELLFELLPERLSVL